MVNMWGIYTPQKEANMYPKAISDLSGWNVRSIACNTKGWMAAADDAVIACMPSPCTGELGTGEKKKSSAQPCIVDTLEGCYVLRLGAGHGREEEKFRPALHCGYSGGLLCAQAGGWACPLSLHCQEPD